MAGEDESKGNAMDATFTIQVRIIIFMSPRYCSGEPGRRGRGRGRGRAEARGGSNDEENHED